MRIYLLLAIVLFQFFCPVVQAKTNDASAHVSWGYKGNSGPARWAQLSPAFSLCATGQRQSPINVEGKVIVVPHRLQLNFKPAELDIMRDGVTALEVENEHLLVNTGHTIQVDYVPSDGEVIKFKGNDYHLVQFHFHTPSETHLHGEGFPLEIHFVSEGTQGKVLVLAVFVKGGEPNAILEDIIQHAPRISGKALHVAEVKINPGALLPKVKNYYHFSGSLTTPPCVENIQWVVLEEPISASPAQIAKMRKLIGMNARPIQSRENRTINYAKQSIFASLLG